MDFEYLWKLFVKAIGLIFYIIFHVVLFFCLLAASITFARSFVLIVAWATSNAIQINAQNETLTLLAFLLFCRQNFIIACIDDGVLRGISKIFGIANADLRFWEGVFEVQLTIFTQIILGPLLKETRDAEPTTFPDGPMTSLPLDPRRGQVFIYTSFVAMILSISSGRTGCTGFCRRVGGETGCLCRRPEDSLGYTSLSFPSIVTFLAFVIPNLVISAIYGLLLNGFYSVGCVIGLDPVLTYYWLIFSAVLIGFGGAAMENRKPFPKPDIKPPLFAFVNNLKAQSYVLHYLVIPALIIPLYNVKVIDLDPQDDNFRMFAILASLNMILQIKLVIGLLRLALEIQKRRSQLPGPSSTPRQREIEHRRFMERRMPMRDVRVRLNEIEENRVVEDEEEDSDSESDDVPTPVVPDVHVNGHLSLEQVEAIQEVIQVVKEECPNAPQIGASAEDTLNNNNV